MHYQDTILWNKSVNLTQNILSLVSKLPDHNSMLSEQVALHAIAVPTRIAEGWTAEIRDDKVRHMSAAHGSLNALTTVLILCEREQWLSPMDLADANALSEEVSRMLTSIRRRLRGDWLPAAAAAQEIATSLH